jgi:DNA mismatch repair protein MutS
MLTLTPLLDQYHKIKKDHKDTVLLFRMGDFYETFYDDARLASDVLGIALTSRPHGKKGRVPLAGVPYRSVDTYIARLVKAGHRVAICDQMEDPKQARGLVRREVTEVVTPGTIVRPSLLEDKKNNYLVSLCKMEDKYGIAICDLSTGEFLVTEVGDGAVLEEVKRVAPSELLVPESFDDSMFANICPITRRDDYLFDFASGTERVISHFKVSHLTGLGLDEKPGAVCAAGACLSYLEETQKRTLPHIRSIRTYAPSDYMTLDSATIRNLELTDRIHGGKEGTLLGLLDVTKTPMGGRLLRRYLLSPLMNVEGIKVRQDGIEELLRASATRLEVRKILSRLADIERLTARVSCDRATPRDLLALADSLALVPEVKRILIDTRSSIVIEAAKDLGDTSGIVAAVKNAIVDAPPISAKDGGIIREGYDASLDELKSISRGGKKWIAELQARERQRTGIASLKVGFNNVFGYYIEITKPNLPLVPADYTRKQTLTNGERFTTPELKEYESKILGAEERSKSMEYDIFADLRRKVAEHSAEIMLAASGIARLDVLSSLAEIAALRGYARPEVGEWDEIDIIEGRHPVVEYLHSGFVPNDMHLSNRVSQIAIVTGPNMAGKSTYIRQVAEIVLLAQVGSFVPARSARIGLVDRIFTRVGASDDLARGVSTFLAEMNETALILNSATERSLIILDEIGRGTSTFDGLSIAWAVVEYLHENPKVRAKTLFATHYHELTELEKMLPRVKNLSIAVLEKDDNIVFLRKVIPGAADRSYGIQVAKLAGIPVEVIQRAKEVLSNLESDELTSTQLPRIGRGKKGPKVESKNQLSIFVMEPHPLLKDLKELDVNKLTPVEALNLLEKLKEKYLDQGQSTKDEGQKYNAD